MVANWISGDLSSKKALDMLLHVSKRRDINECKIQDSCFCHGSSGVGYIFQKLYLKTGLDPFATAADYWLNVTLKYFKEDKNELCLIFR
jgi:lantibiotic biosynthesis protein